MRGESPAGAVVGGASAVVRAPETRLDRRGVVAFLVIAFLVVLGRLPVHTSDGRSA